MTGDQNDMLGRLKSLLPATWFPSTPAGAATNSPVLDGLLSGVAALLAQSYGLLQFVRQQARIATAGGVFLDMVAGDFFGAFLTRRPGETDTALWLRITRELFRPKGTRPALVRALTDLTGQAPVIFEPTNPGDTGGYAAGGLAYGRAGGYGSLLLPFQFFVTAVRPHGGGVASVSGYGNVALSLTGLPGGYGVGAIEYATRGMVATAVSDAAILAGINDVRPVATVAWTQIVSAAPTLPAAPGVATGLSAAPVNDGTTTKLALSWTAAAGATGYYVSYRLTGAGSWTFIVPVLGTSYTATGLSSGTSYDFTVTAFNSAGPAAASAPASASTYSSTLAWGLSGAPQSTAVHGGGSNSYAGVSSAGTNVNTSPNPTTMYFGSSTSASTVPSVGGLTSETLYGAPYYWAAYVPTPATAGTYYLWAVAQTGGVTVGALVSSAITVT